MSGQQQHQVQGPAAAGIWQPARQGRAQTARVWTPAELARLAPLVVQRRLAHSVLVALARDLDRTEGAISIQLSKMRQEARRVAEAQGPPQGGRYPPALVEELRALLRHPGRLPRGAIATLAARHGRTTAALKTRLRDMRSEARDGGVEAPAPLSAAWSEADNEAVRAVLRRHPGPRLPSGCVARLAADLDRTMQSVQCQITRLRKKLAAVAGTPPSMREAPRADGSGRHLDVSSLTWAPAVRHPGTVAPAAGTASAVPAGSSGPRKQHGSWDAQMHAAELRAAHPPERVRRRCIGCRRQFTAPSRFRFRCDRCLKLHSKRTGYDA